jgi:hypothetical protein
VNIRNGLDDFEAALAHESIMRLYFDFAITLVISSGGELRIGNNFSVSLPESPAVDVDPEAPGAAVHAVLALLHQELASVAFDESGRLELIFARGASLMVAPDKQYEVWTYAGAHDGVKIICLPGGGLTTFGL